MRKVLILPHFRKQLKQHLKKYRNLKSDLIETLQNVDQEPAVSLGHRLYKVRLRAQDSHRGKGGGFRVIVFIEHKGNVIPIALYAKSRRGDMSQKEINYHYACIVMELSQ
jgi:mRNA-degrading endonuclease RelE of RelBE toxin-antitoxin system